MASPDSKLNSFFPTRLSSLEFRVFRETGESLRGERVLVTCSGGRDSVSLTHLLHRLSRRLGFEIVAVTYVHHGPTEDARLESYRRTAQERVKELASEKNLPFVCLGPASRALGSEADLREFRREVLDGEAKRLGASVLAFAHHSDDLFETRWIRLLRGCGSLGLTSMTVRRGRIWRPLLTSSRHDVAEYASEQNLVWVEDPSNQDSKTLRNWLRLELFPMISAKRPGSLAAMARSLHTISDDIEGATRLWGKGLEPIGKTEALSRHEFRELDARGRKARLHAFAQERGARELNSNQVEEIAKRLSRFEAQRRKSGTFVVSGLTWSISATHISAEPRLGTKHGTAGPSASGDR